jgi:hypothetical protein
MALAQTHEWIFYEVMWRAFGRNLAYPRPWWVQQYLRRWVDPFDGGLFDAKETAFSSNAAYRYWNMIGVKDATQECLVGQAGEIEPVYDEYAVSFFLFDPATRQCHLPQFASAPSSSLRQQMDRGYLPVIDTTYDSPLGISVTQRAFATTLGLRQRSIVVQRFRATLTGAAPAQAWLCVAVSPVGPTGFQRRDRAGRYRADRRLSYLRWVPTDRVVEVNATWGPLFDTPPASFGVYGNPGSSTDPDRYLTDNPFHDLTASGALNGVDTATDYVAGMCAAVFAWPMSLTAAAREFTLDVKLPVDDYRDAADLAELHAGDPATLEAANATFWTNKLDTSGLQPTLPPGVAHLGNLFRQCRANLLILADGGAIHPGPTIYDSFWIRDSSVEAIACALAGDNDLAESQLGVHHLRAFNLGTGRVGPCAEYGFFGGEHEKNDQEWDSNGEALWAFGRFDRVCGAAFHFGAGIFSPYIIGAARWIRDNRDGFGLLHSGWSAEHIGDKGKPHYWDDFWALAGLWEAAQLATRLGAAETRELWNIYDDVRRAVIDSIRWMLTRQHEQGNWETFIPTGPGDVGRLDSTMIGTLAYFHPCRLYMGKKLGDDIDVAARLTLETIWSHFVTGGGFRHDAAWHAYGPYLTLQLAHSFLLLGDIDRMDQCLAWAVGNAAYAHVSRGVVAGDAWQVVQGGWNEQHCYPVASDFAEVPNDWWYMGDIPHGWAAAEFNLLLRDILFFEADEDGAPHIYLAPGVPAHWVDDGQTIGVAHAPTILGGVFGYTLTHQQSARTVHIRITQAPPRSVPYVYRCRFGAIASAQADGVAIAASGDTVWLPAGTVVATIRYA